jgi:hypothetical protein
MQKKTVVLFLYTFGGEREKQAERGRDNANKIFS